MKERRFLLSVLALVTLPTVAVTAEGPPLKWAVSDDTLAVPFGAILDVAVNDDGVVFLLDAQNMCVRRIDAGGVEIPSLSRRGEGPGEIRHPRLVASRQDGGCIVVQDFHAPAVCCTDDGVVCAGPDVGRIRSRFRTTAFVGTARLDRLERLVIVALTSLDSSQGESALSVFRLTPGEASPTVLFTDNAGLCAGSTVRIRQHAEFFASRCWDIEPSGRLVFADPAGTYSVMVGHPGDGESRRIVIEESTQDRRELERVAKAAGRDIDTFPRVAYLCALGDGLYMVQHGALASAPTPTLIGTFDVVDASGRSRGRHELRCDYTPGRDEYYVRGGTLVVIKGGRSAREAALRQMAEMIGKPMEPDDNGADATPSTDVIEVHAYDLTAHFTR